MSISPTKLKRWRNYCRISDLPYYPHDEFFSWEHSESSYWKSEYLFDEKIWLGNFMYEISFWIDPFGIYCYIYMDNKESSSNYNDEIGDKVNLNFDFLIEDEFI